MKKILSLVLAFALVLAVASSALAAFAWGPAPESADPFGYSIEVIKFTRSTGALGSGNYNIDGNATAVNGADLYFAVKLTVPDLGAAKPVRVNAEASITLTGIDTTGITLPGTPGISGLTAGIYYLEAIGGTFEKIEDFSAGENPVIAARCLDTATAKVSAKVTSKTDLSTLPVTLTKGGYDIIVDTGDVTFEKGGSTIAVFNRDGDGKVTTVSNAADPQAVAALYRWLGTTADAFYDAVDKGLVYMSDDNLIANFGFNHKIENAKTWNANQAPIILDPNVAIPKTGDNTSVVGFAMVMVALVAAAVAVKKVKA